MSEQEVQELIEVLTEACDLFDKIQEKKAVLALNRKEGAMKERLMCSGCVHIIPIPGNCHIGCNNLAAKPERTTWHGRGMWPINFDQATVVSCTGYSKDQKDKKAEPDNPLITLMRLLR